MARPLILSTIFYLLGTLIASGAFAPYVLFSIIIATICFFIYQIQHKKITWFLGLTLLIFFGIGAAQICFTANYFDDLSRYNGETVSITGKIVDLKQTEEYQLLHIRLKSIENSHENGLLALYIYDYDDIDLTYGDEISAIGNFSLREMNRKTGEIERALYDRARGLRGSLTTSPIRIDKLPVSKNPLDLDKFGFTARNYIRSTIRRLLPGDEGELLIGIMLGDKFGFSDELSQSITASGVAHIVSVSGLHLSILLLIFSATMQTFFRRNRAISAAGLLAIAIFYLVIGYSPSLTRAALMTALVLSASFFDRRAEIFTTLSLSALILLIARPYVIFDVGFQLSFAASLGLLILAVPFTKNVKSWLINTLITSAAVAVATAFITAHYFNTINLIAIATNLLVVPLVSIALCLGYITIILPIANFLAYCLYPLLFLTKKIIETAATIPFANLRVPRPGFLALIVYLAILYTIEGAVRHVKNSKIEFTEQ